MSSKRAIALRARLLEQALSYPETVVDHPWGETVVKVNKKVFLFAGVDDGDRVGVSLKLPESRDQALCTDGAASTGYGLGKAGWVTITFGAKLPPVGVLLDWLDESYRAVAPKRLARQLDAISEGRTGPGS
jgi:predicted DNA-binding protein (MmcQ/YjbR family)